MFRRERLTCRSRFGRRDTADYTEKEGWRSMRKRIEIRRGDEYCTKVSKIYDQEDFFYEAYCKAAQGVLDIVRATRKFYLDGEDPEWRDPRGHGAEQSGVDITEFMKLASYPNNFVAFCAGRGQGKSSAMASFSTALRTLRGSVEEKEFWREEITGCSFYVLDPIDPTMMDKEDSILRVIISRMFQRYAEEQDDLCRRRSNYSEKEPELLKGFRQCYRNLDVLQKGRQLQDCYDDLEYLADLGDSSNMKRTFHELVVLFLELMFRKGDGRRQQFLVIQIDDADLNASNAYRIVEELRKYCVVPNIIILMASDFEQLELTVEQYFIEAFDTLWKSKKGDKEVLSHCHRMMERYLDKLIPGARQVHLPQIDNYIKNQENELLLRYIDENPGELDGSGGTKKCLPEDYQNSILQLIYRKTRLILVKPKGYLHNLLPKSMRELTHLLAFLNNLRDIPTEDGALSRVIGIWRKNEFEETKRKKEVKRENEGRNAGEAGSESGRLAAANMEALDLRRKNIDAFTDYLRHCWVKAALNEKQQAVVIPVMETTLDLKIKLLLVKLEEYGEDKYGDSWGKVEERPNPQYTDVIKTLNKLKMQPANTEDFGIIYISAAILTLYMHQLAIQDLEKGLRFEKLIQFMGGDVLQPEVGEFEYKKLKYDRLEVVYDLISAAAPASEGLDATSLETRTTAQLFLSEGEPAQEGQPAQKVPGIALLSSALGNQLSVLRLFKNCLTRTAYQLDPWTTTEVLDIVLSWDLQRRISKKMREKNRAAGHGAGWLRFEQWVHDQLDIMDEVYQSGLNALDNGAAEANLKEALMTDSKYLAALAMGNPGYADGWWKAVKDELREKLEKVCQLLENVDGEMSGRGASAGDEGVDLGVFNTLVECSGILSNWDSSELLTSADDLLSFKAFYTNGVTPRSVMDEAAGILPIFGEGGGAKEQGDEAVGSDMMRELQEKTKGVSVLRGKVKNCQKKLEGIELSYFAKNSVQAAKRGSKAGSPKNPARTGKRGSDNSKKPAQPKGRKNTPSKR